MNDRVDKIIGLLYVICVCLGVIIGLMLTSCTGPRYDYNGTSLFDRAAKA